MSSSPCIRSKNADTGNRRSRVAQIQQSIAALRCVYQQSAHTNNLWISSAIRAGVWKQIFLKIKILW